MLHYFLQILLNASVGAVQILFVATALYLIYNVGRVYHIALAGILAGGAYTVFSLMQGLGWQTSATLLGTLVSIVLMGLLSFFLLKPFLKPEYTFMGLLVSIAFWSASQALLALIFGPEGRFLVDKVLPTFEWAGFNITWAGLWTILAGLILAMAGVFLLYGTPVGRLLRALKQHSASAALLGINEQKVQLLVFFAATALVVFMGFLYGMNQAISPTMGNNTTIAAFLSLLVGGVYDYRGTIVAACLLYIVPDLIIATSIGGESFSDSWRMFFMFLIALVLLCIRPNGIFNPTLRKT